MKAIGAAKFKERCLALIDDLDRDGLVITKHGKPVARLLPIEDSLRNTSAACATRWKSRATSSQPEWNGTPVLNLDARILAFAAIA